ncbi:PREDICTED: two-component response regulator ARR17-like isoform X2 [Lupinus angustifolius]|uniref:two-component response regulator ARR17-like isoform X2 n=1 Tax=Lupinus angustifolius TaxID=3871 RepID=UPI00092FB4AA|nr:PREDICTED: two-component response regulator ARR17-like isoform X2 [Lupinus angustifolius]
MELVETPKLQQQKKQQHFHVLVVDDSVIDRKLLERLLRDSSCKVTFMESGDKALKYLGLLDDIDNDSSTSSQPLPLQDGSSWKDVPVVIMSSENVPSRISRCLEGGAKEFLLKPLQFSDLEKLQPYFMTSFDNCSHQKYANSSKASNNGNNNNNIKNNDMTKLKGMHGEHSFKLWYVTAAILQFWKSI